MVSTTPKDIAVFIDGTWNSQGSRASTNVRKLYQATWTGKIAGREQVKLYIPGVGTKPVAEGEALADEEYRAHLALYLERELPRRFGRTRVATGGAFGKGTAARIKGAYSTICHEFDRRRSDRVFLFGFSRGAFAARSLAGFMEKVGLLLRERLDAVEEAYALYESGKDPSQSLLAQFLYKLTGRRMPGPDDETWAPVHFLGVWDTVASLGLPSRLAWLSAPFTEYHQVEVPPNVMCARHGLALHELRTSFEPLLWERGGHSDLEQVWFPGAHADVGGGYRAGETCLSDTSLMWMAAEAEAKGLALDRASQHLNRAPCAPHVHHELRGLFLPTMPMVRKWLRLQGWDSAETFHFHGSARDYLFATPRPEYKFKHPLVNAALRQADELASPRMVISRLKGIRVVS